MSFAIGAASAFARLRHSRKSQTGHNRSSGRGSEISGQRTLNARTRRMSADNEQQNEADHRITSSARTRTDCGMVRPSALAVLRLNLGHNRELAP